MPALLDREYRLNLYSYTQVRTHSFAALPNTGVAGLPYGCVLTP